MRKGLNLSFQKFLLITALLIIMIVGIAIIATGDKNLEQQRTNIIYQEVL